MRTNSHHQVLLINPTTHFLIREVVYETDLRNHLREADKRRVEHVIEALKFQGFVVYAGGSVIMDQREEEYRPYTQIDLLAINTKVKIAKMNRSLAQYLTHESSPFDYSSAKFLIERPEPRGSLYDGSIGRRWIINPSFPLNTRASPIDLSLMSRGEFRRVVRQ